MIIENYDNPDNSLDLKIILEHMLEMKKLLLEYKTKIKYYKKHKVNTDHLQTKLINTLDRLHAIKEETIKTYKYNKNNDDNSEKCKFENCNREATYRKLKVGNCHLKDTKYVYCSYHRPKNSINKKFPYKSIFNKVNIPLHYFNHTNENIINDYHDYIYKTLKNNKFKFPIKITIYTENLLYDPFNSNMLK